MKKLLLAVLCAPLMVLAQTYPSPTFNTLTLQVPLSTANGGTGVTAATGTGSVVLSNSPTLYNPSIIGSLTAPYSIALNNPSANTINGKLNQIVNLTDFNPTCNGTTNDDTAVSLAIASIGSTPTTLMISCPVKIAANHTFAPGTQLNFEANGEIIGTAGTELVQLQQQILAGRTQIFSNLAAQADIGMVVYPEWFGGNQAVSDASGGFNNAAATLKNVGGIISAAAGNYAWQNTVSLPSKVTLVGAGKNVTIFNVTASNIDGIHVIGSLGSPIINPSLASFSLTSFTAGTSNTGITLSYTALAKLLDLQVNGFLTGINMECATNSAFERTGATYSAATNGFIGWNINGAGGCAGGNESSTWRDTYVSGTGAYNGPTGQIGYKAYGAYVSDLYFSNAATAETNYGYYFEYGSATAGGYADVIVQNPVVDGFTEQAILVDQLPAQQMITISDGWLNPVSTLAETDGLYCNACVGMFQASNMQIGGEANYAYAVGARFVNSSNAKVTGSAFNDNKYAIEENGSTGNIYSSNSVSNISAHAGAVDFFLTGSTGSMVTNNTLSGYALFGVQADSTSTSVAVVNNVVNGGNITTPVQNNSKNAIGGAMPVPH